MEEYLKTKTKMEFIEVVLKKYKDILPDTARRRWYDLRKRYGEQESIQELSVPQPEERSTFHPSIIDDEGVELSEPGQLKLLQYLDMKRYNHKTTRKYLEKNGFTESELNWMDERNMIESES